VIGAHFGQQRASRQDGVGGDQLAIVARVDNGAVISSSAAWATIE